MSASVAFNVTFGVTPGYNHDNGGADVASAFDAMATVSRAWQVACEVEQQLTGMVVGGVVSPALVAYPQLFGCPEGGEIAALVQGVSNPKFLAEAAHNRFRESVVNVVERVRIALNQTTALVSFSDASAVYLTANPTPHPPSGDHRSGESGVGQ